MITTNADFVSLDKSGVRSQNRKTQFGRPPLSPTAGYAIAARGDVLDPIATGIYNQPAAGDILLASPLGVAARQRELPTVSVMRHNLQSCYAEA